MNKVVLITGTSTGLGLSLAVKLAQQGHIVYATMRNLDKSEALQAAAKDVTGKLHIKQLDVQDNQSVQSCVADIIKSEGRIDTLINNAGAGFIRTTEQATEEEINWVMDVNFHGVVRCTKAVLPHMRQARNGHVINITSVGGLVGQPFADFYCAAKFAVEGYVESLASYVTPAFNVNFTNVEPGGIISEFAQNVMGQIEKSGGILDDEYRPLLEKFLAPGKRHSAEDLYQTAEQVADVVIECANSPKPPIRKRTSGWAEDFTRFKTQADPQGFEQQQNVYKTFQ